jgi:predicted permease
MADHRTVSPGFFDALGIPLLEGRRFDANDRAGNPPVAIVDEQLAREAWPGASAIGRRLNVETLAGDEFVRTWAQVVGVVRHAKFQDLVSEGRPQVYVPQAQSPRPVMSYAVRTSGDPRALVEPIRRVLSRLDPDLPLSRPALLSDSVSRAREACRFTALLAGTLAGIALLLASVGVYGVISFLVGQRTREIGIRMALGATRRDVVSLFLSEGTRIVAFGLAAGVAAGIGTLRLSASLFFGVRPLDPANLAAAAAVLAAVGVAATAVPALRAARVEPLTALKQE